jgi:hypothetical protein
MGYPKMYKKNQSMKNLFLIVLIVFTSISCPKEKKNPFAPGSPLSLIMSIILGLQNKPTFSPAPGKFTEPVTVKITNSKNNPGLPIYYTTNGSAANCSSTKYGNAKGVVLDLGRIYTLNAVECFEGIPSSLGSGEYSVGFCNYAGNYEGRLFFIRNQFGSYSPSPVEGSFQYSITPSLNSCLTMNNNSGTISGTCLNTIAEQEYRISRVIQMGNTENFICLAKIGVYQWANEAYLKAPNTEAADSFGVSISISGDTIVVGANSEDSSQTTIINGTTAASDNNALTSGAAYVFRRTGTTWANEAYLKAPNTEAGDFFGQSVSISGETIVVGALGESSSQTTITNGTTSSGNGAPGSGAAYVFRRTGSSWTNEAYLKAPNAEASDSFGTSISISGETIVVGAPDEDSSQTTITNGNTNAGAGATDSGAAYVFRRTGSIWTNEAYLKAPNAETTDRFGTSICISGDTIVVGSAVEDSSQTTITNGTLSQASYQALATNQGAAYVFRRTGTTWVNEAYLKAPNTENSDSFGQAFISGDTIVVGAFSEDSLQTTITNGTLIQASDFSGTNSGAAYVFRRTGTTWTNEAYLKAPNSESGDGFGRVSISGDTIVATALSEDSLQTTITNGTLIQAPDTSAINTGAAYVFRRTGTTWVNEAYLKAPNAEANDNFGISPAISGDTIVVGALSEDSLQTTITNGTLMQASDVGGTNSGAAYVFRLR